MQKTPTQTLCGFHDMKAAPELTAKSPGEFGSLRSCVFTQSGASLREPWRNLTVWWGGRNGVETGEGVDQGQEGIFLMAAVPSRP